MATWSEWVLRLGGCKTHMQVTKLAAQAYKDGVVNAALAARIEQRHAEISMQGARVVQVHTLREVRNAAARADRNCDERPGRTGDPYSWGVGGGKIVAYLSWKLGEARRAAGLEPKREGN